MCRQARPTAYYVHASVPMEVYEAGVRSTVIIMIGTKQMHDEHREITWIYSYRNRGTY